MRVLVTGGAGFVGSHVVEKLLSAGHEVAVLDDLSTGHARNVPKGVELYECDLRNATGVDGVFARFRPEVVSHQGAQTSVAVSTREPLRDAAINVIGTLHVLEAARTHGTSRIVFASTGGAIYGEVSDGRARVGQPERPLSPYACSKLAGEAYLRTYKALHDLEYNVLRYANVYGPRQDPHGEAGVVAIFSQRIVAKQSVQINARREKGDPGCIRDYVYVADVARANLLAIEGKITAPIVNVCTGEETTTEDLARILERALGAAVPRTFGERRAGDLERSVLDPGDAPHGRATSIDAGLGETAQWFASRAS